MLSCFVLTQLVVPYFSISTLFELLAEKAVFSLSSSLCQGVMALFSASFINRRVMIQPLKS